MAEDVDDREDVSRRCLDCGDVFVITAAERDWFTDKRLQLPRRCIECRRERRASKRGQRVEHLEA